MTSPFLSSRNIDHIFQICSLFLKDKYKIELPEQQLRSVLVKCMEELINYYQENPPTPSMEEMNKRTIIKAKDRIFILARDMNMPRHPPPPSHVTVSQVTPAPAPAPPPVPPSPIMEEQDHSEDTEVFIKKLQNLELQRTASVTVSPASQEPLLKQVVPTAPPPSSNGTTVLYIPSSAPSGPRMSKPFVVYSGDRMWSYFHERSVMSWEGPTPVADATYMKCTNILLSQALHIITPIIKIRIEGPGNHSVETLCTFSKKGRKWDIWEPASETIGTLRVVPCPWTIRLYDVGNRLLDLGKDGYTIQEAVILINGNTKWTFGEEIPMLTRGMTLLCKCNDGTIKKHSALHVHETSVEVEGAHTGVVGYLCAVEDLQITIIMEMIKNETLTHNSPNEHGNTTIPPRVTGGGTSRGAIDPATKGGK